MNQCVMDCDSIVQRTNAAGGSSWVQKQAENSDFCSFSAAFWTIWNRFKILRRNRNFGILLQRGIAIFDCEAGALPGRFLPELGRSSERPFFYPALCASHRVDLMSTSREAVSTQR